MLDSNCEISQTSDGDYYSVKIVSHRTSCCLIIQFIGLIEPILYEQITVQHTVWFIIHTKLSLIHNISSLIKPVMVRQQGKLPDSNCGRVVVPSDAWDGTTTMLNIMFDSNYFELDHTAHDLTPAWVIRYQPCTQSADRIVLKLVEL